MIWYVSIMILLKIHGSMQQQQKYTITDNFIRNFNVWLADSFDSDVYSVTRDSQKLSYVFLVKKKNNCNNQKSYIYNQSMK